MLNSLKDLYISYPFMESVYPALPAWTEHVKDLHIVAELEPGDTTSDTNGDRLMAFVVDFDTTNMEADVEIWYGNQVVACTVPIYVDTDGCPDTQTYMLVDSGFAPSGTYGQRIHPDCIVYLQKAPSIARQFTAVADFQNGYNVIASDIEDGVLFYGVEGGGLGNEVVVLGGSSAVAPYAMGKGLRSINGKSGAVWIRGDYPVEETVTVSAGTCSFSVKTNEVE